MRQPHSVFRKKIIGLCLIPFLSAVLCLIGLYGEFLADNEATTWRFRVRNTERPTPDPKIKIIAIDQDSLNFRAKQDNALTWPWPREMYVPLLEFVERAGARAIAFDILFTEESRNGVEDDRIFGQALAKSKIPVVMASVPTNDPESASNPVAVARALEDGSGRVRNWRDSLLPRRSFGYGYLQAPVVELLQGPVTVGSVVGVQDPDGIYRRAVGGAFVGNGSLLSLPFAMVASSLSDIPRVNYQRDDGTFIVNFTRGHPPYEMFSYDAVAQSYLDIMSGREPTVPFAAFKDAFVLVGVDAPALLDLRPTPLDPRSPGVVLNATILDNLLHRRFVSEPTMDKVAAFVVIFSVIVVAIVLFVPHGGASFTLAVVFMGAFVYSTFWFAENGTWFPLVWPLISIISASIAALALQYQLEGRAHRFVRDAFRFYVSESVIDKIVADPNALALGGEKRELTLFFSDIKGFTSISERIEASKLVPLLNRFLTEMTDIIMEEGGTVDKYVGDAIVAFWNAPLAVPDHGERAVRAALRCQHRLNEIRDELRQEFGAVLCMRVGIHTGMVSVGNFGSAKRFNYTVIGDAANLASRLEGANKVFGTEILISHATAETLTKDNRSFFLRELGEIKVVGREDVVTVFEPRLSEPPSRFAEGLSLLRAGRREAAREIFLLYRDDPPSVAYHERIASEPRGDAVWVLRDK